MSGCSPMFSEETLLISVNLMLGLIIDLLSDLSISEIVPRLPVNAINMRPRRATTERLTETDRGAPTVVEEHVNCNYFHASLHLPCLQHR